MKMAEKKRIPLSWGEWRAVQSWESQGRFDRNYAFQAKVLIAPWFFSRTVLGAAGESEKGKIWLPSTKS